MNTSLRGRGKWGDFLVAILPLSWCANILLNSNFILRMFEWQNESSLFTVRIHGKQWYWVYKFDLIDAIDILTVPKNIGNNRWVVGTPQELVVCESYLQAIQLRAQEDWIRNYWKKKIEEDLKTFKSVELGASYTSQSLVNENFTFKSQTREKFKQYYSNIISYPLTNILTGELTTSTPRVTDFETSPNPSEYTNNEISGNLDSIHKIKKKLNFVDMINGWSNALITDFFSKFKTITTPNINNFDFSTIKASKLFSNITLELNNNFITVENYLGPISCVINETLLTGLVKKPKILLDFANMEFRFLQIFDTSELNENSHYNYDELDDTWDVENNIRHQVNVGPVRVLKHLLTTEYLKSSTDLLKLNFYDNSNQTAIKVPDNDNFWVLKQKRYKKKQIINPSYAKDVEYADFETVRNIYKKHIIENLKLVEDLDFKMDPYTLYKCIRGNRNRTESLPIHLYRRLLRTKRTLVLPVHVNMTVVTNSYDVVHSWFLPGLGIKMDCVPGRSTHHSLYLDNIGFYYGQCAEICGRYHHHMPIRLCALPFEHFLVWWQLKGLPKLLRLKKNKTKLIEYTNLKYTW